MGQHTDPTEAEIMTVSRQLHKAGFGGWLAVMEGIYYSREEVRLLMVRQLGMPGSSWDDALKAFQQRRLAANSLYQ
jgi:hypothetical protein